MNLMRRVYEQQVGGTNGTKISLLAEPRAEHGASVHYEVYSGLRRHALTFQHGPAGGDVHEGVTNEVLLAMVSDRLAGFMAGPFACPENERALFHVSAALEALHARSANRAARGVEGTHQP